MIGGVPMLFSGAAAAVSGYRYLRLRILTELAVNQAPAISVRWRVGATNYPTSNMTGNTAPSPLVASASTEFDTALYPAWKAFDGATSTFWSPAYVGTPHWLQIDLGAGNEITPSGVVITPITGAGYYPTSFVCQGSNTGAFAGEETLLYTSATGLTSGWGNEAPRLFTF